MDAEQLKAEAGSFLSQRLFNVKCCGMTYSGTGMCLVAASALIVLHVVIAKCICCKMKKLKCKAKKADEKTS